MPLYQCRVTDGGGNKKELYREAVSEEVLVLELSSKGFYPLSVKTARDSGKGEMERFGKKTVIEFTDTLALMLESGLSLKDSLAVAETVYFRGKTARLISFISGKINKGESLYRVLRELEKSFNPVYLGLIRIGEKIGSLDKIIRRLSVYINDEKKLNEKIISSLIYPAMVLSIAVTGGALAVLLLFPRIKEMFESLGQGNSPEMTGSMELMKSISTGSLIFIITLLILLITVLVLKSGRGKAAVGIDRFLLRLPFYGKIAAGKESLNLCFSMETLSGSRIPIEEALTESEKVLKNMAFKSGIIKIRDKIIKGESLSSAFLADAAFPRRIGHWIGIGERSGDVEKVFGQLRKYYQGEIEKSASRIMLMLEPALILVSGLIIILIIIVFILPVFTIYGSIF